MEKRFQQKPKREISAYSTSHKKIFDVQRASYQAKDAGPSRPQNKPETDHGRTSSTPDLTIKQGDRRTTNSRQSKPKQVWQPKPSNHGTSDLGKGQVSLEWKNPVLRTNSTPDMFRHRPGKKSVSTSNDTTLADSQPLQDKDKIPPLQGGGLLRTTYINNTGGGTVYYKAKTIRSQNDDSSEQQSYPSHEENFPRVYHMYPN